MVIKIFKTGIVSVTFRPKSIDEIITLCRENSLELIEVGSDVHAPKENLASAEAIAKCAAESSIGIVSYGTYYRLGQYADAKAEFSAYLAAADKLGTKNLRLWAGAKNSEQVTPDERAALIAEAKLCAQLAGEVGKTISFEFHGGTLTNTPESALDFIKSVAMPNATLYWQPNQYKDVDFNIASLKLVLDYVSSIHVFAWDAKGGPCIRYPLAEHEADWRKYLDILAADGKEHALLLEFVKDDSAEQLIADAKTLNEWSKRYAV